MDGTISPTLVLIGALMVGAGFYVIQRARFLMPLLVERSAYLQRHPRLTRYLFMLLLTVGILAAGMGCRVLFIWLRG